MFVNLFIKRTVDKRIHDIGRILNKIWHNWGDLYKNSLKQFNIIQNYILKIIYE